MPNIHLKLPDDLAQRVRALQAATGASATELIRRALDDYLPHPGESHLEWTARRSRHNLLPGERR